MYTRVPLKKQFVFNFLFFFQVSRSRYNTTSRKSTRRNIVINFILPNVVGRRAYFPKHRFSSTYTARTVGNSIIQSVYRFTSGLSVVCDVFVKSFYNTYIYFKRDGMSEFSFITRLL